MFHTGGCSPGMAQILIPAPAGKKQFENIKSKLAGVFRGLPAASCSGHVVKDVLLEVVYCLVFILFFIPVFLIECEPLFMFVNSTLWGTTVFPRK